MGAKQSVDETPTTPTSPRVTPVGSQTGGETPLPALLDKQHASHEQAPSPKSDGSATSRHDDSEAASPLDASVPGRAASLRSLSRRLSSSRRGLRGVFAVVSDPPRGLRPAARRKKLRVDGKLQIRTRPNWPRRARTCTRRNIDWPTWPRRSERSSRSCRPSSTRNSQRAPGANTHRSHRPHRTLVFRVATATAAHLTASPQG